MANGVARPDLKGAEYRNAFQRALDKFERQVDRSHPMDHGIAPAQVWYDEASKIDQHALDAMQYAVQGVATTNAKPQRTPIENFSNADMVMDMIRRGYAVMKLPADGGPPETLR